MLKLEADKMKNAIARAKAVHPKVKVISAADRVYSVSGSRGGWYTVKFVVVNGVKLSECDCAAGRKAQMCYHVAAASAVNIGVQGMRKAASPVGSELSIETMNAFYHRNIGWMI